ncbi:hypothetical protein D3C76_1660500 [compost metagenome]
MCHQLMFVRQENRQTVWRPFVVIVDTGQELPFRLHNGLIAHRAGPGIDIVMGVHHARVVQFGDKFLQLLIRRRAIIDDDQFPVVVVLT